MRCHNCGSGRVETDASTGTTYCVSCGGVLEENNIVAEVSFSEMAGGKTVLQGAFAGESGRISGGGPFGHGRGKEGQEQAIDNGRQKIARLAHGLRLPERFREAAQRYYNLAVINRFTRGRKSDQVAAVCLYIVCRNEQSSQMLIDFSDLLQVNVFILGATFLKLVRVLNLKLPLIDPSIYISRFAAACDFGDYTQRVAQDAVRLVQRMDRDWIRTGRRPAGICGACLLMAARINGFKRSAKELIYVVKVAEQTIQKRLKEFGDTESANLTVRDFRDIWIETEADPPAYTKNRKNAKQEHSVPEEVHLESPSPITHKVEPVSTPESTIKESPSSDQEKETSKIPSIKSPKLTSSQQSSPSTPSQQHLTSSSQEKELKEEQAENFKQEMGTQSQDNLDGSTLVETQQTDSSTQSSDLGETQIERNSQGMDGLANPELEEQAKALEAEMEQYMDEAVKASKEMAQENESDSEEEEEISLSDVDDDEIEAMILTPDEVERKTFIWYNANKEYLEEMEAKARKIEMDKRNGVYTKRNKGAKRKKLPTASTPAEAAKQLLNTRKISRKINQAVFDDMFESAETIAKIKEMDKKKQNGELLPDGPMEVVEESGDTPIPKKRKTLDEHGHVVQGNQQDGGDEHEEEEEDDEDMAEEDMAEDEVLLRRARERLGYVDLYDYAEEYD